jgi:hypothetical protein
LCLLALKRKDSPIGDGKTRVKSIPENSVEDRASFPKNIYFQKF